MRKTETANNRIHSGHQTLSHSFFQAKEDIPGAFATARLAFGAGDAGRWRGRFAPPSVRQHAKIKLRNQ